MTDATQPVVSAAMEYGEGVRPGVVLNTPRGISSAGTCWACDWGYEGDDCTCGASIIVVYLCNGATPQERR